MSGHMKRKGPAVMHMFTNGPCRGLLSAFRAQAVSSAGAVGFSLLFQDPLCRSCSIPVVRPEVPWKRRPAQSCSCRREQQERIQLSDSSKAGAAFCRLPGGICSAVTHFAFFLIRSQNERSFENALCFSIKKNKEMITVIQLHNMTQASYTLRGAFWAAVGSHGTERGQIPSLQQCPVSLRSQQLLSLLVRKYYKIRPL